MEKMDIEKVHVRLTTLVELYIKTIIKEYRENILDIRYQYLKNIKDYGQIIQIYETGSINGWANNNLISMPICAERILQKISKIPGFGIYKNHQTYNENNLITNNNTFSTYLLHVFISGTNAQEYYEDLLLHEVLHFCGSGGSTALKEGINELLTRKLAIKYNFRTNGCAYPKEVHIAFKLQKVWGEEVINNIAFMNNENEIETYIANFLGEDALNLYLNIQTLMEKEFQNKYYSKMDSYKGILGIINKTKDYKKIDYTHVENLIKEYENKNRISR